MTNFLLFLGIVACIVYLIHWIKSALAESRERRRLHARWYPRYAQDLERSRGAMDDDELDAYATNHYKTVISQYRKRGQHDDPYWTRSTADLDGEYVSWLVGQQHGDDVLAWYSEPERVFNSAMCVRSTKAPAEERTEWKLETDEVPRWLIEAFRDQNDDGGDDHEAIDASAILAKAAALGSGLSRRPASQPRDAE